MPNFFFGALLLWFGIEISRDWLLLSFTKMTRIGARPSPLPLCPRQGPLLSASWIERSAASSLEGAAGSADATAR